MNEPAALGMVLAMLVDRNGKPVRGGSGKGHLYASSDGLVVLRPSAAQEAFHRGTTVALLASVALVESILRNLPDLPVLALAFGRPEAEERFAGRWAGSAPVTIRMVVTSPLVSPAASKIDQRSWLVVVLPSVPVTPLTRSLAAGYP